MREEPDRRRVAEQCLQIRSVSSLQKKVSFHGLINGAKGRIVEVFFSFS
jgi:hypothetical protein